MLKRLLRSIIIILVCGEFVHAQTNLVRNSGFEGATTKAGLPGEGWWVYEARGQPEVNVDRTVAHSGKISARLQAKADAKFVLVGPRFEVSPGDELQFEAWVRAQDLPPGAKANYAGLAFRDGTGRVFDRAYFQTGEIGRDWMRVSGTATAAPNAISAEVHLGYTNAPGILWFDDVSAVITNPQSLSLVEGARQWVGEQKITVRVVNREVSPFRGHLRAVVGRKTTEIPVTLEPASEQRLPVPITLSGIGSHNYQLTLSDAAGKKLRTLQGKFRASAPLVLFPACPCYHVVGEGGGETRVDARLVVDPKQRAGLRIVFDLADANGNTLQSMDGTVAKGDLVGATLRVPVSTQGIFKVTARLLDPAGKAIAKAETDIHVQARDEARVTLGSDGFLRLGGKKHFPIGMYSCSQYETMGQAGFSATHHYGITTGEADEAINLNDPHLKELLDRSWASGMRMMVEFPRKAIEKAQWAQIRRRIETFRHHPGLLCWGSEERVARGEAPLANISALYRLVRELDPNHPLVLGDTRDVIGKLQKDRRNFFPDDCMDVGIWWWYPIPLHAPDANGLEGREENMGLLQPPPWLTTTLSKKPLWIAIQSYQQPRKDARFPTPAEYRCMAYLSIINGVKGLWFYTGSGQKDWQGKPAGLLNKPEEGHWDYVQKLVRELRELEPAITSTPVSGTMQMTPAEAPVEFSLREVDGKNYLLAANKSDRPQTVQFTSRLLNGRRAEVLGEKRSATIEGSTLVDNFDSFGVHVYHIH